MILLDPSNRILSETVAALMTPPQQVQAEDDAKPASIAPSQREPTDVRLCDFDDVQYRVVIDASNREQIRVSMQLPCYREIAAVGGKETLTSIYKDLVCDTVDTGYDMTLQLNLSQFDNADNKLKDELIQKIGLLKSNIVSGVFLHYFIPLLNGTASPVRTQPFQFNLRHDTTVYLLPKPDRVIVVYSLDFAAETDRVIARVFMQEFVDARRRLGAAPPCTFTQQAPLELKEAFPATANLTGHLGFLAFAVMKSHLEGGRLQRVAQTLQQFRNYLQYHIKCSKTYFHSRMRARVVASLKVLNRAKIEYPPELKQKEMKTIQGKTFTRQV